MYCNASTPPLLLDIKRPAVPSDASDGPSIATPALAAYAAILCATAVWLLQQQRQRRKRSFVSPAAGSSLSTGATCRKGKLGANKVEGIEVQREMGEGRNANQTAAETDESMLCRDAHGAVLQQSWLSLPRLQLRIIGQDPARFLALLAVLAASSAAWALSVPLMGKLLADLASEQPLQLKQTLFVLICVKISGPVLEYLKYMLVTTLEAEREFALKTIVFSHITSLDLSYFDKSRKGEITPLGTPLLTS